MDTYIFHSPHLLKSCSEYYDMQIANSDWQITQFHIACENCWDYLLYRVFQLDMTYFEVQDGHLKMTSPAGMVFFPETNLPRFFLSEIRPLMGENHFTFGPIPK